jgi:parallel beta-helix repeat protein
MRPSSAKSENSVHGTNPHEVAYDSDEERKFKKGGKMNLLALDKWKTSELLALKNIKHIVHPDGVLIDRTALIVTGHPVQQEFARTHFETLHQAVEVAEDGQIIVCQAGKHYVGSRTVLLDKRLKIEGVRDVNSLPDPDALVPRIRDKDRLKNPDTTLIDLEYLNCDVRLFTDYGVPAITIAGSGIEVVGITVCQRINFKVTHLPQGEVAMCSVEINGGSCVFRECCFSSEGGMAVKVREGASPLFSKCTFEFAKLQGLWFGSRSSGRVEDCRIFSCNEANLQIEGLADPVVTRCKIFDSFACGVRVTDRGKGLLIDNEIYNCASACVRVDDEAEPIFRNNHIHDGKVEGVSVMSNGLGVFEKNDITGNTSSGVVILSGADPTFLHNTIHRNRVHGVHILGQGNGTITENDIFQNVLAGIYIETASDPIYVERGKHVRAVARVRALTRERARRHLYRDCERPHRDAQPHIQRAWHGRDGGRQRAGDDTRQRHLLEQALWRRGQEWRAAPRPRQPHIRGRRRWHPCRRGRQRQVLAQ